MAMQTLNFHLLNRQDGQFCSSVYREKQQRNMPPHDHLFYEILLIEKGTGIHVTASGREALKAGDLFLIRPQVWHGFEQTRELALANLLIAPKTIRQFKDNFSFPERKFGLFNRGKVPARLQPPTALHAAPAQMHAIFQYIGAIEKEQEERALGWPEATALLAMQILIIVGRIALDFPHSGPHAVLPPPVVAAISYLEANLDRTVSLGELSRHCATAASHLSRQFNRALGIGINAYVHRLRSEEACRLLRITSLSVTEIAMKLGYGDGAYFSRCFRQQVGMSPFEYRKSGFKLCEDSLPPYHLPEASEKQIDRGQPTAGVIA